MDLPSRQSISRWYDEVEKAMHSPGEVERERAEGGNVPLGSWKYSQQGKKTSGDHQAKQRDTMSMSSTYREHVEAVQRPYNGDTAYGEWDRDEQERQARLHDRKMARREKKAYRNRSPSPPPPLAPSPNRQEDHSQSQSSGTSPKYQKKGKGRKVELWKTFKASNVHVPPGGRLTLAPSRMTGKGLFARSAKSGPVSVDKKRPPSEGDWREAWRRKGGTPKQARDNVDGHTSSQTMKTRSYSRPIEGRPTASPGRSSHLSPKLDRRPRPYYSPSWPTWKNSPSTEPSYPRRRVSGKDLSGQIEDDVSNDKATRRMRGASENSRSHISASQDAYAAQPVRRPQRSSRVSSHNWRRPPAQLHKHEEVTRAFRPVTRGEDSPYDSYSPRDRYILPDHEDTVYHKPIPLEDNTYHRNLPVESVQQRPVSQYYQVGPDKWDRAFSPPTYHTTHNEQEYVDQTIKSFRYGRPPIPLHDEPRPIDDGQYDLTPDVPDIESDRAFWQETKPITQARVFHFISPNFHPEPRHELVHNRTGHIERSDDLDELIQQLEEETGGPPKKKQVFSPLTSIFELHGDHPEELILTPQQNPPTLFDPSSYEFDLGPTPIKNQTRHPATPSVRSRPSHPSFVPRSLPRSALPYILENSTPRPLNTTLKGRYGDTFQFTPRAL